MGLTQTCSRESTGGPTALSRVDSSSYRRQSGCGMDAKPSIPPKYSPELVERAVLEVVIELHPAVMTMAELTLRIAGDPRDRREIDAITCAVRDLRGAGLLQADHNERVEPTPAALRAAALLLGWSKS